MENQKSLNKRIEDVRNYLRANFEERDDVIDVLMVAWFGGMNAVIIGPPGTAKTQIVQLFAQTVGVEAASHLMHSFMKPEELFGQYSLLALAQDRRERILTGRELQCVEMAFLDEVFNPPPSLLNTLLDLLNTHTFMGEPTPLRSVFGASNQYPEGLGSSKPNQQGSDALYDRFHLRVTVSGIQSDKSWLRLILVDSPPHQAPDPLTPEENAQIRDRASKVHITRNASKALFEIRRKLKAEGIYVSDRRWKIAIKAVKTYASLRGCPEATPYDLSILTHVLWSFPENRRDVERMVLDVSRPAEALARHYINQFSAEAAKIAATTEFNSDAQTSARLDLNAKFIKAEAEIRLVMEETGGHLEGERALGFLSKLRKELAADLMGKLNPELASFDELFRAARSGEED